MKIFCILITSLFLSTFAYGEDTYLAKPTGEYSVGFQEMRVVNGELKEGSYVCPKKDFWYKKGYEKYFGLDNQVNFCHEIMARIYYPAVQENSPNYENYYSPLINTLKDIIKSDVDKYKFMEITSSEIAELDKIKTFSIRDASVLAQNFPVILFKPSANIFSSVQQNENIIEEVVSHGYIVVAVNSTYVDGSVLLPADARWPQGRLLFPFGWRWSGQQLDEQGIFDDNRGAEVKATMVSDILFVKHLLDTASNLIPKVILNHMLLNQIGIMGQYRGGLATMETLKKNPKLFQAAVTFDAYANKFNDETYDKNDLVGTRQTPLLKLYSANWKVNAKIPKDKKLTLFKNNYSALLSPSEENKTYTTEQSFGDYATLQYQPTIKKWMNYVDPSLKQRGTADGRKTTQVINDHVVKFFDQYLKNKPSENFTACAPLSKDSLLTCGK